MFNHVYFFYSCEAKRACDNLLPVYGNVYESWVEYLSLICVMVEV